jgi:hypothetical protein
MAEGFLNVDRGISLDSKYPNIWPAIQWFSSVQPPMTQDDFRKICIDNFGEEYKSGILGKDASGNAVPKRFRRFYWTVIQNTRIVQERTAAASTDRKWDHDWSRAIAPMGGADECERFLAPKSGQKATKNTAAQNAYVGVVQWLEENAASPGKNWTDGFARQIGWCSMAEGIMDNVVYKGAQYTRNESLQGGKIARESGVGNHGSSSVQKHRERIQQVMNAIDPWFFRHLSDKTKSDIKGGDLWVKEARDYLIANYGNSWNIDGEKIVEIATRFGQIADVFSQLQEIVNIIVANRQDRIEIARRILVDEKGEAREL